MVKLNDISSARVNHHCSGGEIINNLFTLAPFMDIKTIGSKFKEAREKKGFTQQKVADELKVSLRSVQYFEKGEKEWGFSKTITAFELVGCKLLIVENLFVVE